MTNPAHALSAIALLFLPFAGGAPPTFDGPAAELAPPPAVRYADDPADTLDQEARRALSRGDYREAARLFGRIVDEIPDSEYAPDAHYWQAFSLYRAGGSANLHRAVEALEAQRRRHPDAATREDADALLIRIRGTLARQGDAESARHVTEQARRVDCPDGEQEMRVAALNALLQMDEAKALPILEDLLARRDECSIELRRRAVFMVADLEGDQSEAILLDVARNDPDAGVREKAVFWLSEVETESAVDALETILMGDTEQRLREKALFALSEHESPRSRAILRRFARDGGQPTELREKAIFWLAEDDDDPGNVEFLEDLFTRVGEESLRERILFAVAESEASSATPWLLGVAGDASHSMEIRKKALFWAGEAVEDGAGDADAILGLYDRMDERELKEQLIFVYAELVEDVPGALDRLFEIARSDADVELRKKALFWIGESDDPRAADFLREIVNP